MWSLALSLQCRLYKEGGVERGSGEKEVVEEEEEEEQEEEEEEEEEEQEEEVLPC